MQLDAAESCICTGFSDDVIHCLLSLPDPSPQKSHVHEPMHGPMLPMLFLEFFRSCHGAAASVNPVSKLS